MNNQSELLLKKLILLAVLLLSAESFLESRSHAESLYKCGETWTTFPCDQSSKPVKNLPAVRKKGGKDLPKSLENLAGAPRRLCQRDARGWDLEIVSATVESHDDEFVLSVKVRNQSKKNFASPFFLYIRDPKRGIERLVKLDKYLAFKTTDFYEENLGFFAPAGLYGNILEIQLVYSPAAECRKKKIEVLKNAGKPLQGSFLKALQGLETDIGDLYADLPAREKIASSREKDFSLSRAGIIAARMRKICRFIQKGEMTFRCFTLQERLERLVERVKAIKTA